MKLTMHEKRLLKGLKKNIQFTNRFRWVYVVIGVLLILMSLGAYLYLLFCGKAHQAGLLVNHPAFYLCAIFGGGSVGFGIRGFKGHAASELLVKVVEELSSDGS